MKLRKVCGEQLHPISSLNLSRTMSFCGALVDSTRSPHTTMPSPLPLCLLRRWTAGLPDMMVCLFCQHALRAAMRLLRHLRDHPALCVWEVFRACRGQPKLHDGFHFDSLHDFGGFRPTLMKAS